LIGEELRLKQLWEDTGAREFGLTVFAGLVVAYVRHGLQHHWALWDSLGDFFAAWFFHTIAVVMLMAASLAAIIYTHKFFLGYEKKEFGREVAFYILMTILVAALSIAVVAHWPSSGDDFDDSSAFVVLIG
jgi:hypothetical protein